MEVLKKQSFQNSFLMITCKTELIAQARGNVDGLFLFVLHCFDFNITKSVKLFS